MGGLCGKEEVAQKAKAAANGAKDAGGKVGGAAMGGIAAGAGAVADAAPSVEAIKEGGKEFAKDLNEAMPGLEQAVKAGRLG